MALKKKNWKQERKAELRSKITCAGIFTGIAILDLALFGKVFQKTFPDVFAKETESTSEYVNMNEVVDFESNDNSLYLQLSDGTGYYWEKPAIEQMWCTVTNIAYCDDGTDVLVEMPNGELHIYHTYETLDANTTSVCFEVARENKNDYSQYEIVSFE